MRYWPRLALGVMMALAPAVSSGVMGPALVAAADGTITEFPTPTAGAGAAGIAVGPDGNLWVGESNPNGAILRLTTSGQGTEFFTDRFNNQAIGMTAGPDGNMWFGDSAANFEGLGRITLSGGVTWLTPPTNWAFPSSLAVGPDGNLWFAEQGAHQIGRVTPEGTFTEYPLTAPNSYPVDIIEGPDGALWFTDGYGNRIGRITTDGEVTEFSVPSKDATPNALAVGPDGAIWFTEGTANKIGRLDIATKAISEFAVPAPPAPYLNGPGAIVAGPDGKLWFTDGYASEIGTVTTSGIITMTATPTPNSNPQGITVGPDGNVWFTEADASKVARIELDLVPQELAGTTTVATTTSGSTVVRLTSDAELPANAEQSFAVQATGRYAGFVLRPLGADASAATMVTGSQFDHCWVTACPATSPTDQVSATGFSSPDGGQHYTIPAGYYDLYVVADGAPAKITLHLGELSGSTAVFPVVPAAPSVQSATLQNTSPSSSVVAYSGSVNDGVGPAGGTLINAIDLTGSDPTAASYGICSYDNGPPAQGIYTPECTQATNNGTTWSGTNHLTGTGQSDELYTETGMLAAPSETWNIGGFADGAAVSVDSVHLLSVNVSFGLEANDPVLPEVRAPVFLPLAGLLAVGGLLWRRRRRQHGPVLRNVSPAAN